MTRPTGPTKTAVRVLFDLQPTLAAETRKQTLLEEEHRRWTAAWAPAIAALGAPADIDPEDAGELVTRWATAEGVVTARGRTRRRLDGMDEDAAELARLAKTIAEPVGLNLPDDEVVAAQMLEMRWRDSEKARVQRSHLEPGLASLASLLDKRRGEVDAALGQLRDLTTQGGDAEMDEAQLAGLATRQAERNGVLQNFHWVEKQTF